MNKPAMLEDVFVVARATDTNGDPVAITAAKGGVEPIFVTFPKSKPFTQDYNLLKSVLGDKRARTVGYDAEVAIIEWLRDGQIELLPAPKPL